MRVVIQRVLESSVTIDGTRVAEIGHGLVVLVGIEQGDTGEAIRDAIARHLPAGEDGQDLLPLLNSIFLCSCPKQKQRKNCWDVSALI